MKDFIITCTSTCDMTPYYLRQHNMYYISFYYYLDDERFYDDFFKEHTVKEYYDKIKTCTVKTSQPDPEQYKELWNKLISQGYDILHVELDSGISGAVNSALIAKSLVEETNKDAKIFVVDSLTATCGFGLLLEKLYEYKNEGRSIEETYEYAEKLKHNINVIFLVENLDQLIKGGRISKVAGGVGKLFNVVPILHVANNGRLENIKKARGINNAMDEMINFMKQNIVENEKIFMSHADSPENAYKLFNKIKENFKNNSILEENIYTIGTVIGGHTGRGALVVAYIGNGRI
ncbi:MAG: DegV family protein [Lachnospiraceae bacterium]|nr:DegV family protein [Lachnospiraceae bacterium]